MTTTTTANGPTLAALLKDPAYRPYFVRQPVLPKNLYHPAPFYVWGLKTNGRWAGQAVADYPTAFALTNRTLPPPAPDHLRSARRQLRKDSFRTGTSCRPPHH